MAEVTVGVRMAGSKPVLVSCGFHLEDLDVKVEESAFSSLYELAIQVRPRTFRGTTFQSEPLKMRKVSIV